MVKVLLVRGMTGDKKMVGGEGCVDEVGDYDGRNFWGVRAVRTWGCCGLWCGKESCVSSLMSYLLEYRLHLDGIYTFSFDCVFSSWCCGFSYLVTN